jgi:glycerol-3-phosphate dehydrogenase
VTDDDVRYLLEGHDHHFVTPLAPADVLGTFAGVRPLLRGTDGEPSARSREWRLLTGPTGLLSAVGGKWTTYRGMAESITDAVMTLVGRRGRCRTRSLPLGAPRGEWPAFESSMVTNLRQRRGLSDASARHLVRRYGRRVGDVARLLTPELARPVIEGEPDLLVELKYQRESEMAVKPEDSLLRRTRLGLFHPRLLAEAGDLL